MGGKVLKEWYAIGKFGSKLFTNVPNSEDKMKYYYVFILKI